MKMIILVLVLLGLNQMARAEEFEIVGQVGDRTTEFRAKPSGKDFILSLYSSDLGSSETSMGQKNFDWMHERIYEMSKLKKGDLPCNRDQVTVKVTEGSKSLLQYEVCLTGKSERARSMRSFLSTLSTGI